MSSRFWLKKRGGYPRAVAETRFYCTFNTWGDFLSQRITDGGGEHHVTSFHDEPVGHDGGVSSQGIAGLGQRTSHLNQLVKQTRVTYVSPERKHIRDQYSLNWKVCGLVQ